MIAAAHSTGARIGAFFAESVLSCGGQVIYPPGYLKVRLVPTQRWVVSSGTSCADPVLRLAGLITLCYGAVQRINKEIECSL